MSAHTPGPWLVSNDGYNYIVGTARGVDEIADLIDSEADARLIHAAPDLLNACQFAEGVLISGVLPGPGCDDAAELAMVVNMLRAAVAKAEGRGP